MVRAPDNRRRSASPMTSLISLMPLDTALKLMNSERVWLAMTRGQGGLAHPRRPPEYHGGEPVGGDHPPEDFPLSQQMLLSGDVLQAFRPHPAGQRLELVRREQGLLKHAHPLL